MNSHSLLAICRPTLDIHPHAVDAKDVHHAGGIYQVAGDGSTRVGINAQKSVLLRDVQPAELVC